MNNNEHNEHSQFSKNINPADDPRLTAYALGEMEAAERSAFEAEIRNNPAAQSAIAEIRAVTGQLESALAAEPVEQRAAAPAVAPLEQDWRAAREAEAAARRKRKAERPFSFPYFLVAGLATACFVVLFFTVLKPEKPLGKTIAQIDENTVVINGVTYTALPFANTQTNTPVVVQTAPAATAPTTVVTEPPIAIVGLHSGSTNANTPPAAAPQIAFTSGSSVATLASTGLANYTSPLSKSAVENSRVMTWGMGGSTVSGLDGAKIGLDIQALNGASIAGPSLAVGDLAGANSRATYGISNALGGATTKTDNFYFANGAVSGGNVAVTAPSFSVSSGRLDIGAPTQVVSLGFRAGAPRPAASVVPPAYNTESYAALPDNAFQRTTENPLSTFSIDIDTASYTNTRRFIMDGKRPPKDAVRVEEMLNYFSYDYAAPAKDSATPFAATMEVSAAPWNPAHRLVRIGIKGREIDNDARPPANLVFLLDTSGSMDAPNRLPLVKESMRMLINKLRPDDRVAIVTYSSTINMALTSTPVSEKSEIFAALDALRAAGGTNGGGGIQLAYDVAKANFIKDGANRVILCTDGDFNIGIQNRADLTKLIEEKAKSGVFLTVLGYGMGNYKDATLQLLADKGNGNHGYIDTRDEARRLLVEKTTSTLVTIAKDVKLQVEFNPQQAASYRLIGYEKRALAAQDFNNDKVDAGEIGAGHTVTALYEVVPANLAEKDSGEASASAEINPVDTLKYQIQTIVTTAPKVELKGELLTLKIRFKAPSSEMSEKAEFVLEDKGRAFAEASNDFKFATAVAGFGMVLRNSPDKGLATYDTILAWAESGVTAANDADGRRSEFLDLVRRAKQMTTN